MKRGGPGGPPGSRHSAITKASFGEPRTFPASGGAMEGSGVMARSMRPVRARRHAERRNLSAAARDIGEAGGAQARQKAREFSAEEIRGEVHEHVAVIHFADIGDVREYFAANGNALLNDPGAVLGGKRALDG